MDKKWQVNNFREYAALYIIYPVATPLLGKWFRRVYEAVNEVLNQKRIWVFGHKKVNKARRAIAPRADSSAAW